MKINGFDYVALSFGAGVQSTAIALLVRHDPQILRDAGLQLPNAAYFADTQRENSRTYQHLGKMMVDGVFDKQLPLQIVTEGDLGSSEIIRGKENRSFLPLYTMDRHGKQGMLMRKCTSEFKIKPLTAAIRKDAGIKPRKHGKKDSVGKWIGFSTDELYRLNTDPPAKAFCNVFPLVVLNWSRTDAFEYCKSKGYRPPKSRCYFCPFIRDWNDIARNEPEEFERAIEFDREIRDLTKQRVNNPCYIHRSLQPLDKAIEDQGNLFEGFRTDRYQPDDTLDDFADECQGMCGL